MIYAILITISIVSLVMMLVFALISALRDYDMPDWMFATLIVFGCLLVISLATAGIVAIWEFVL